MDTLTKSERTKRYIIERSAPVFNQKGFAGTSMADIMQVTGLTKGGIYGNFESKDQIALNVFDYNLQVLFESYRAKIKSEKDAVGKLHALLGYFKNINFHSELPGGCPILNTSIEADDTHPELKARVVRAIDIWRETVVKVIENGKRYNQIKPDVNSRKMANVFIALVEGGVMLAKAYQNNKYISDVFDHIKQTIDRDLKR